MNFYPDWLREKREHNQKKFKLLLIALVVLALIHYFLIANKQNKLQSEQIRLGQSLQVNEKQLIANHGLSQELKLLNDRLKDKKILFSTEETQIIIEAINDLLISNNAQMVQVSLNNDSLINSNYLNSNTALDSPIGITAQFIISPMNQFEIINQVIQSPYLFAINQINRDENGLINWQIGIPTRKKEDVNENNLRQITKLGIFPSIKAVEKVVEIPKITIPTPVNINCDLPRLEGIVYKGVTDAIVFMNGKIERLNAKINCYQITAIFPQKIQLTDTNGQIFELFTRPNE